VKPEIPVGEVSSRSGPLLAASGVFEAIIRGKGGHATLPQLSMDPIIMVLPMSLLDYKTLFLVRLILFTLRYIWFILIFPL